MFYKIRFKIIFVKMGLRSGQQQFGKSSKIVLILMPVPSLRLFFFSCKLKDRISFESERKNNDPRPGRPKGSPLSHSVHAKLYCVPRQWERMSVKAYVQLPGIFDCSIRRLFEYARRYLCPKIDPWKSLLVAQLVVRPYDWKLGWH